LYFYLQKQGVPPDLRAKVIQKVYEERRKLRAIEREIREIHGDIGVVGGRRIREKIIGCACELRE